MNKSLFVSGMFLALWSSACDRSNFAGAAAAGQAYQVTVEDADASAADAEGNETPVSPQSSSPPDEDAEACAKLAGLSSDKVKVSGSQKDIKLSNKDALALKVTGNKNEVSIDFTNPLPTTTVKAICLFIAGNQNQVSFNIGLHVSAIYIVARGNQANIKIETSKDSVIDTIEMDAKGNGATLEISGEGKFPCDASNSSIICQKPAVNEAAAP